MKNIRSDDDFMAKCQNIDFSADSQNFEANLEALKGKLNQIEKERNNMRKSRKIPIAIAAVLAAVMIPVAALAAGPSILQYLEITISRSDDHEVNITIDTNDLAIEYLGDGSVMIRFDAMLDSEAMRYMDDEEITVQITAGAQIVQMDVRHFDDLDDVLNHLDAYDLMLPAYLPEGFAFERAALWVSPEELASSWHMNIYYGDSQSRLRIRILYSPEGFTTVTQPSDLEEITANEGGGFIAFGDDIPGVQVGNAVFMFDSADLTQEQLARIAESLQ